MTKVKQYSLCAHTVTSGLGDMTRLCCTSAAVPLPAALHEQNRSISAADWGSPAGPGAWHPGTHSAWQRGTTNLPSQT